MWQVTVPASTWSRIAGYLLDQIFLTVLNALAGAALALLLVPAGVEASEPFLSAFGFGLVAFYFIASWARRGRTLGQRLLSIHVVRRGAGGELGGIGWGPAAARLLGYSICWFTLGIGFLFGLHDKIAGTEAVIARRESAREQTQRPPRAASGPRAGRAGHRERSRARRAT